MTSRKFIPKAFPVPGLRRTLEVEMRKPGNIVIPINRTLLWEFWVINGSCDPGRNIFYGSYPWKMGKAPRPQKEGTPKILVARGACPRSDDPVVIKDLLLNNNLTDLVRLAETLQEHHPEIEAARFFHARSIRFFWEAFFGHSRFLDVAKEIWDIPSLIVSSGYMRNYSPAGGETLPVDDRLVEIGKECGIPVLFPGFPWGGE